MELMQTPILKLIVLTLTLVLTLLLLLRRRREARRRQVLVVDRHGVVDYTAIVLGQPGRRVLAPTMDMPGIRRGMRERLRRALRRGKGQPMAVRVEAHVTRPEPPARSALPIGPRRYRRLAQVPVAHDRRRGPTGKEQKD